MQQRLISLNATLTSQHPDILRTKEEIRNLKAAGVRIITEFTGGSSNPQFIEVRSRLTDARAQEKAARSEVNMVKEEISDLVQIAAKLPSINNQLREIEARHATVNGEYENLQGRLAEAEVAAQAAQTDIGNNFSVVDPAQVPTAPLIRSRLILHMFGVVLGVIAAIGSAMLLGLVLPGKNANVPSSPVGRVVFYASASLAVMVIFSFIMVDFFNQMVTFV